MGSLGATVSAALTSQGTGSGKKPESRHSAPGDAYEPGRSSEVAADIAGDDAIAFRKHTLDLGACEAVCVTDLNRDGRLDIVSGEN